LNQGITGGLIKPVSMGLTMKTIEHPPRRDPVKVGTLHHDRTMKTIELSFVAFNIFKLMLLISITLATSIISSCP
jgi:hypothetical protein